MTHWEQLGGRRELGREKAGEIRHEAGHSYRAGLRLVPTPARFRVQKTGLQMFSSEEIRKSK